MNSRPSNCCVRIDKWIGIVLSRNALWRLPDQASPPSRQTVRGATAYVTLEPCAKRSNGAPSCADLLIQAGIARVVIAASDPHPFACGVGVERLRAAGVSVEVGLFAEEARAQNAAFFAKWGE